jgi:hypothetical protein
MWLGGILTSRVELALQILLGDLDIAHGHADICMPQQFKLPLAEPATPQIHPFRVGGLFAQ